MEAVKTVEDEAVVQNGTVLEHGKVEPSDELTAWNGVTCRQWTRIMTQPGVVTARCPGSGDETHAYVVEIRYLARKHYIQTTSLGKYLKRTFKGEHISVEDMSKRIMLDLVNEISPQEMIVTLLRDPHDGKHVAVETHYHVEVEGEPDPETGKIRYDSSHPVPTKRVGL